MFRKAIFYIFIFCIGHHATGQIGFVIGNNENHGESTSKSDNIKFSTKELAFSITRNAISDAEKAVKIYKWITKNIAYDNELMRNENLQKQIYTSEENVVKYVLERKMALCGGFALLFKFLCADVGIQAEEVHGYTKDYSGKLQKRKKPNHTWNAVRLNGKWQLLDITWAIGHGTNSKPDSFWYLTTPENFIYSHYPEDTKWTLLQNPLSFSEFQNNLNR